MDWSVQQALRGSEYRWQVVPLFGEGMAGMSRHDAISTIDAFVRLKPGGCGTNHFLP